MAIDIASVFLFWLSKHNCCRNWNLLRFLIAGPSLRCSWKIILTLCLSIKFIKITPEDVVFITSQSGNLFSWRPKKNPLMLTHQLFSTLSHTNFQLLYLSYYTIITPHICNGYTKFGCKKSFTIIFNRVSVVTRLTFTCSKSATETLEKCVNMFKVNNKSTRITSMKSFWYFYC